MTQPSYKIRDIKLADNPVIATMMREVLVEFGLPKVGTVYEDVILDTLYEFYDREQACHGREGSLRVTKSRCSGRFAASCRKK